MNNWFTFGLNLDLNVTELNVLEINSFGYADKRTCVRRVLTIWKDKFGTEATWDKIFVALRNIKEIALVQDLEAKRSCSMSVQEQQSQGATARCVQSAEQKFKETSNC